MRVPSVRRARRPNVLFDRASNDLNESREITASIDMESSRAPQDIPIA